MTEYLRLWSSAVDPADIEEIRLLFADDVRPAFVARPGCLGVQLAICTTKNAGGLVETECISRWSSMTEMEAALASREIQEAMVRIRQLLRQEPVAKVLELLE